MGHYEIGGGDGVEREQALRKTNSFSICIMIEGYSLRAGTAYTAFGAVILVSGVFNVDFVIHHV
jgi:hypothetical protein